MCKAKKGGRGLPFWGKQCFPHHRSPIPQALWFPNLTLGGFPESSLLQGIQGHTQRRAWTSDLGWVPAGAPRFRNYRIVYDFTTLSLSFSSIIWGNKICFLGLNW